MARHNSRETEFGDTRAGSRGSRGGGDAPLGNAARHAGEPPWYSVLGVKVHGVGPPQAIQRIEHWITTGDRRYVCHANVHGVMEARHDSTLRRSYNTAGLTVPDGMPLVWVGRLRGHTGVRRVYGPDLMLALCEAGARRGYASFFYGGAPGVAQALAERLTRRFPGLRNAGTHAPPYRELTREEDDAVVEQINRARPDIVWVGLGCPKQEKWMASHRARLLAPVLLGVGAAFDFHTGRVPQAPRWMQAGGIEWLFRLLQEPHRLWYRYLILNPLFLFHLLLELSGIRRYE